MQSAVFRILFVALLACAQSQAVKRTRCHEGYRANTGAMAASSAKALASAWDRSAETLRAVHGAVYGSEGFLHDLVTASIAREFAWINGDPGGAKTYLSRALFEMQLNALAEKDKKIFVLQFHKLMTEGIITGFPKIQKMLDHGRYELETGTSLVGEKFIFAILDEAEKANPATLTALLSVLNERKAFLGSEVVDAMLSSGVITSNKTLAEFIQTSGDRPAFEALADRMGIKRHVFNQAPSSAERVALYDALKAAGGVDRKASLPLRELSELVDKVDITSEIEPLAGLIMNLDGIFTQKADESLAKIRNGENVPEYFAANQFTNRSNVRILKMMKASFLAKQLLDGVPMDKLRLKMERADLVHLATGGLYGGPAQVRLKRFPVDKVQVRGEYGEPRDVGVEWSPYENAIYLNDRENFKRYRFAFDPTTGKLTPSAELSGSKLLLDAELETALAKAVDKLKKKHEPDFAKPQFEVDDGIARVLAMQTVPARTRLELEAIQADLQTFVSQLHSALDAKPKVDPQKVLAELKSHKEAVEAEAAKLSALMAKTKADQKMPSEQKVAVYYDAVQRSLKLLKTMYPEQEHALHALFVSALGNNHVYLFGPPGGAKTSMSREVLGALIAWENLNSPAMKKNAKEFASKFASRLAAKDKRAADLFLLQFHKLMPEGVIVGFPKLQKQIDTGKLEFDLSTSLAHEKFIYAILDEVEKGNPAVLTTLLSVLNEREVFAGNEVFKAGLRMAALTSNKMPSEFLDYFEDDRPTGTAVMDRAINKAYVGNKFSSPEQLTRFLMLVEAGLKPKFEAPLPLQELKPLADKVQIDGYMKHIFAQIHDGFIARRLKAEEGSQTLRTLSPSEFPDYYVKAASGSNRTFNALVEQLKTHFIVHQIANGVPFDKLRYEIQLQDIPIMLQGMGYWTPARLQPQYDGNGLLSFAMPPSPLDTLKDAPYVNNRNRYTLGNLHGETTDFKEVADKLVLDLLTTYREKIAKYPNLFPSLFSSPEQREKWLEKKKR